MPASPQLIESIVKDIREGKNADLLEKLREHPEVVNEKHQGRALFNWAFVVGNETAIFALGGMGGMFKGDDVKTTKYLLDAIVSVGFENTVSRDGYGTGPITGYRQDIKPDRIAKVKDHLQQASIEYPDESNLAEYAKFAAVVRASHRLAIDGSTGAYRQLGEDKEVDKLFADLMHGSTPDITKNWELLVQHGVDKPSRKSETLSNMAGVAIMPEFLRLAAGNINLGVLNTDRLKNNLRTGVLMPLLAKNGVGSAVASIDHYADHAAEIHEGSRQIPASWESHPVFAREPNSGFGEPIPVGEVKVPTDIVAGAEAEFMGRKSIAPSLNIVDLRSAQAEYHALSTLGLLEDKAAQPKGYLFSINDVRGLDPYAKGKPLAVFSIQMDTAYPKGGQIGYVKETMRINPPVIGKEVDATQRADIEKAFAWFKENLPGKFRGTTREYKKSTLPKIIHDLGFIPDQAANDAVVQKLRDVGALPESIANTQALAEQGNIVTAGATVLRSPTDGGKAIYPDFEAAPLPYGQLQELSGRAEQLRREFSEKSGLEAESRRR